MVVELPCDRSQIDEPFDDRGQWPLQIRKALDQAVDDAFLVRRIHQDGPFPAQRTDEGLREPPHGWIPTKVEKLGMIRFSGCQLVMAGPLERQCFVWPGVLPDRYRRHDGFEIEVITRIGQISHGPARARQQFRLTGRRDLLDPLLFLRQAVRRHVAHVPISF